MLSKCLRASSLQGPSESWLLKTVVISDNFLVADDIIFNVMSFSKFPVPSSTCIDVALLRQTATATETKM